MPTISLKGEYESEKISQEIDLVIDYQIPRISKVRNLKPDVQQGLKEHLKEIPHGTYLWLHLILDVIRKSLDSTFKRLKRLIDNLPRTVEDAYEKILENIDDSDNRKLARRLLHITVAALKPLTLEEMNIALTIDENLQSEENFYQSVDDLDLESKESFRNKIRNMCGLFISISDSKIYLIHQTAREFLISKDPDHDSINRSSLKCEVWRHSLCSVESNMVLLKICLYYLLPREFNDKKKPLLKPYIVSETDIDINKFIHYAANCWFMHFRQAKIRDEDDSVASSNRCVRSSFLSIRNVEYMELPRDI